MGQHNSQLVFSENGNMNGLRLKIIFGLGLLIFCFTDVCAWNPVGHVLVAQIAYNDMTPVDQKKVEDLAALIFKQLPLDQQNEINSRYRNLSLFAKISFLPDDWRNLTLGDLFAIFHATLPGNLQAFADRSTKQWHYINRPYPNNTSCNRIHFPNIVWALNELENAFINTKDPNTKALLMVLIEHFIADIHQPLHTITKVDAFCNGDAGGNGFCLNGNPYFCSERLHALWDNGAGYLRKLNILQASYDLKIIQPTSEKINNLTAKDWLNENEQYASAIYQLTEYNGVPLEYYRFVQNVTKSQMVLAGYRLSRVMSNLLNKSNTLEIEHHTEKNRRAGFFQKARDFIYSITH